MMQTNKIYQGNNLEILRTFADNSVDCVVSSPPYYGLRDYDIPKSIFGGKKDCKHDFMCYDLVINNDQTAGEMQKCNVGSVGRDKPINVSICRKCNAWNGQLGLEPTPEMFVEHLIEIFEEVRRVLKPEGTCFVNLGNSYSSAKSRYSSSAQTINGEKERNEPTQNNKPDMYRHPYFKEKDLIPTAWMFGLEALKKGWYLRQDIIWDKPNPMPESVTDRPTKAHEYILFLTKSSRYYFDYKAIQTPAKEISNKRRTRTWSGNIANQYPTNNGNGNASNMGKYHGKEELSEADKTARCRSVWTINVVKESDIPRNKPQKSNKAMQAYLEEMKQKGKEIVKKQISHYATFPIELPKKCILAGCPVGGVVLDPFFGSGTTGLAALRLGRKYIGIEIGENYVQMAEKRLTQIGIEI
jgi:DNA modification methylase